MRLLLDEMYSGAIAEQLRRRGHDVEAVVERKELRRLADQDLLAAANSERRAVVTENLRDFVPLATSLVQQGGKHHGLVLIEPDKYPRGNRKTIGRLVKALDALLKDNPKSRATSAMYWV